jgi:hypothetical protein
VPELRTPETAQADAEGRVQRRNSTVAYVVGGPLTLLALVVPFVAGRAYWGVLIALPAGAATALGVLGRKRRDSSLSLWGFGLVWVAIFAFGTYVNVLSP